MSLPYDFYPAVLYAIDRISIGKTKTAACDEANINIATFENYIKANTELQELLREAEQRGYDAMAEALVDIDTHKLHGRSDPKMAKVISDNIKWLLDKRRPKEYGQRVTVDHNLTADRAIIEALTAARNRTNVLPAPELEVIDITPVNEDTLLAELLS